MRVRLEAQISHIERRGDEKLVCCRVQGKEETIDVHEILVGAGRAPNVEGLNLETAGVQYDARAIQVSDRLQTLVRASMLSATFAWLGTSLMPPIFPLAS
jgi:pyruvate/2-oxoglutarate dehydrogenase complex dihydrolipoamide dehydrogenase (E3) component